MFSSSRTTGGRTAVVKLGSRQGDMQVVTDGLKPDDMVVVNGIQRARPGAKVTPVRQEQASAKERGRAIRKRRSGDGSGAAKKP